jgi:hypothetical protein
MTPEEEFWSGRLRFDRSDNAKSGTMTLEEKILAAACVVTISVSVYVTVLVITALRKYIGG